MDSSFLLLLLEIAFWFSCFLVIETYVIFPKLLDFLARDKRQNQNIWSLQDQELPHVDILLAVYNEEGVLEKKLQSIFDTNYPLTHLHLFIGSDASTDKTNDIVLSYQEKYPSIYFKIFERSGKSQIINSLSRKSNSSVIVCTDANVYFEIDTLYHLVKHYKEPSIGMVGGNILNPDFKKTGISFQEKKYLERENRMKYLEGISMGAMIGAFGGCFSIRRNLFIEVPQNWLVDDFYIGMQVLRQGKKTINELSAICTEDVSNKIMEEFRRKVRISAGNFQNLFEFSDLMLPMKGGIAFCFISHKVLRWITPFLLIIIFVLNLMLYKYGFIYKLALMGQAGLLVGIVLDHFVRSFGIHIKLLRFITHFYSMNVALFMGFIRYVMGVKTSLWKPTERNQ
jgi:cellulose synthase/poly-beta-1,6-N-acetylglucosamine synthase-like glycosyltransferase